MKLGYRLSLPAYALACAVAVYGCLTCSSAATPDGGTAPPAASQPVMADFETMFRLTGDQYRNSIADIFGSDIKVAGRFDPEVRVDGLLAVGDSTGTVSPAGAEEDVALARSISAQVVDPAHRDKLVPCKPQDLKKMDDNCAVAFYAKYGRLLFRRPLTSAELRDQLSLTRTAVGKLGDFYTGLQYGLARMLVSPQFLFVHFTPDPDNKQYLDAYSKAARLSFFLWNTTPDDELLLAAEHGDLNTADGLNQQITRLMNSPRLEVGVRAFFTDMLDLDTAAQTVMDPIIYPQFTAAVGPDSKEETLRTLVDLLLTQKDDYRDIFTTRKTFLTRALGAVYHVPVDVTGLGWAPYEYPADAERAGILTQISFLAPHSHPGISSPTRRGKGLRELLLCETIPPPPGNIDFSKFNAASDTANMTTRQRLELHRANPTCAGCHRLTDPIGVGLENFDGAGTFRTTENGALIDPSGSIDGTSYTNVNGLGRAAHDDPAAVSCVVNRLYSYGVRRAIAAQDRADISSIAKQFAADGYRFPQLIQLIVADDAFWRVEPQAQPQPDVKLTQNGSSGRHG